MNKAEFTNLIIHPDKLGNEHIDTLKKIVADYPYFSTAQILLAKSLFNINHYEYGKQLKKTALFVANREVLNQFLNNIPEEIEEKNSLLHVFDELKAEKVSKPDFEAGKLEQEALLFEAQNIISNNVIPSQEIPLEIENFVENTLEFVENKNESFTNNFDISEPILENIVNEITERENKLATDIEQDIVNDNVSENILELAVEINEIITDNFDCVVPILENNVYENPVIETTNIEEIVENYTESNTEIGFQLEETEGKLVKYVNAEVFLPNFDEASLFADEQDIETITKSVLPNSINNNISIPEIDSEITFESNNVSLENILDSEFENENTTKEIAVNKDFEKIEKTILDNEIANAEATIEAANLNFFEWLEVNKKETVNENDEIVISQETNFYEDDSFVYKVKQIIKSKSENDLINNISTGIDTAHDSNVAFVKKNNISDSIQETHANYNAKVESILPDFEALNIIEIEEEKSYIIYDKKEGLIPNYETPVFDPLFNSHFESKLNETVSNENDAVEDFNNFIIDNSLFENAFSTIYIPLPVKETEKDVNKLLENETINVKSVTSKNEIDNILDKFMRENPSISRPKTEFFDPITVAKNSAEEKDEIVSETLASIYLKQGLVKKSILTYEKLCLIYPHKNAYFAALINKIKTEYNIN